uniref:Uncharacterized protein n=1 Tax=Physcomitrium patens TaxID=3218 RepID=A0A2K1IST4_PHYPA|nr:hypothetical protein PHYPA_026466 [Physcomitrium patens]
MVLQIAVDDSIGSHGYSFRIHIAGTGSEQKVGYRFLAPRNNLHVWKTLAFYLPKSESESLSIAGLVQGPDPSKQKLISAECSRILAPTDIALGNKIDSSFGPVSHLPLSNCLLPT